MDSAGSPCSRCALLLLLAAFGNDFASSAEETPGSLCLEVNALLQVYVKPPVAVCRAAVV